MTGDMTFWSKGLGIACPLGPHHGGPRTWARPPTTRSGPSQTIPIGFLMAKTTSMPNFSSSPWAIRVTCGTPGRPCPRLCWPLTRHGRGQGPTCPGPYMSRALHTWPGPCMPFLWGSRRGSRCRIEGGHGDLSGSPIGGGGEGHGDGGDRVGNDGSHRFGTLDGTVYSSVKI